MHVMRVDAEFSDDHCEHYDDCSEPISYNVTICDAPELEGDPDTYILCSAHAAQGMLNFLDRSDAKED